MKLSEMHQSYRLVIPSVWVGTEGQSTGPVRARIPTGMRTNWEVKSDFSIVPTATGKPYVLRKPSYFRMESDQPRTSKEANFLKWKIVNAYKQHLIDQYLAKAGNNVQINPKQIFIKDVFGPK